MELHIGIPARALFASSRWRGSGWVILLFCLVLPILRGSLPPPDGYEGSENRVYRVFVKRGSTSQFTVSKADGEKTNFLWQATTKNFPYFVFLGNNGSNIVTMGTWGSSTNYAVAVYSARGELAHHSGADFGPPPPTSEVTSDNPPHYLDPFAGRWYEDSFHFFYPEEAPRLFCIWLAWRDSWMAFDLSNGSVVTPHKVTLDAINRRASDMAREEVRDDGQGMRKLRALKFITWQHQPGDRTILEKALRATDFYTSLGSVDAYPNLVAGSHLRSNADFLLAKWDGVANQSQRPYQSDDARQQSGVAGPPVHLGEVSGTIALHEPIKKKKGTLTIYLEPKGSAAQDTLEHVFSYSFPNRDDGKDTSSYLFDFQAIAPGDYYVRAIWKTKPPKAGAVPWHAAVGDRVSPRRELITVRPGKVTANVAIDCTTLYHP